MSWQMVDCASRFELQPIPKLVLLCLAHNAKEADRRALPGLDELLLWTGRGKTKVSAALAELETVELIARLKYAAPGVRAEWLVLPHGGCCSRHQPIAFTRVEAKAFTRGGTDKTPTLPVSDLNAFTSPPTTVPPRVNAPQVTPRDIPQRSRSSSPTSPPARDSWAALDYPDTQPQTGTR